MSPSPRIRPDTGRVVAITGARTFLGTELAARLDDDPRYRRVLALDIREPELLEGRAELHPVDLTSPGVASELADLFDSEEVDTLVHGAFLTYPTHATSWAHELEDIGTMHVVEAAERSRVPSFVLLSSTLVYGVNKDNPTYLRETDELRGRRGSRYFMDRVRAEAQVAAFAGRNPEASVTSLRMAPTIGPSIQNFYTRFFARPFAPSLMGHDPLVQLLHESDAVNATKLAVDSGFRGPVNIAADGVLPYSTVLALLGRVPIPLPGILAGAITTALWSTQVGDVPPSFVDFLRYVCVTDTSRARSELGFRPRWDIRGTLADFLGVADDGTDILNAQG